MSAPTITYVAGFLSIQGYVLKTVSPNMPAVGEVWYSATGVGTPDSNPGAWTNEISVGAVTDGGTEWYWYWAVTPANGFAISRYKLGTYTSLWSVVVAYP